MKNLLLFLSGLVFLSSCQWGHNPEERITITIPENSENLIAFCLGSTATDSIEVIELLITGVFTNSISCPEHFIEEELIELGEVKLQARSTPDEDCLGLLKKTKYDLYDVLIKLDSVAVLVQDEVRQEVILDHTEYVQVNPRSLYPADNISNRLSIKLDWDRSSLEEENGRLIFYPRFQSFWPESE